MKVLVGLAFLAEFPEGNGLSNPARNPSFVKLKMLISFLGPIRKLLKINK